MHLLSLFFQPISLIVVFNGYVRRHLNPVESSTGPFKFSKQLFTEGDIRDRSGRPNPAPYFASPDNPSGSQDDILRIHADCNFPCCENLKGSENCKKFSLVIGLAQMVEDVGRNGHLVFGKDPVPSQSFDSILNGRWTFGEN